METKGSSLLKEDGICKIVLIMSICILLLVTVSGRCLAGGFEPVDIRKVKVGGEIGRRIDITIRNNVLVIDTDKDFLKPFQDRNRGGGYIGLGKFIDSLVHFAAYSNDSAVQDLKNEVVRKTIATQEEDGYIGIVKAENRMWNLWDIHEMGYLVLGLTNDYKYFQEDSSLEAAEKLAQYIINRWSEDKNRVTNEWISVYVATTGLETAMLNLYEQTRDRQYLDFCVNHRKLAEWKVGIIEGRWGNLEGHAYHYICRCLAQLKLYNIEPDERLLVKSQRAMEYLTGEDGLLIPGLCGYQECWHSNQQGFFKLGETCATAYLIRWLGTLLQMEGDSNYGDIMERAIYNGLFAAQSPDGRKLRYYSPFEGKRVYFQGDTYCCPCNYRRIIAELPGLIYYKWKGGIAINLYSESAARIELENGSAVNVRQETDYPNSGKVLIHLDPEQLSEFSLRLRIPSWCPKAHIKIVDGNYEVEAQGGAFVSLKRKWRKGECVELQMPMSWRLIKGRKSQSGRVAVMRGPQLFGLNPDRQEDFDAEIMRLIYIDPDSPELSDEDDAIRPGGLTCRASFWNPNNYNAQAEPGIKLMLTEYADPGCQATYFLVPNPNSAILVDDELIR
ncbi:MAG: glycoside hydrolase family 127 protein [Sedimentisphaerales bacterium]|nr:glycoside hydrolase family 127 protein [Sedimentisphaerales bacterium]